MPALTSSCSTALEWPKILQSLPCTSQQQQILATDHLMRRLTLPSRHTHPIRTRVYRSNRQGAPPRSSREMTNMGSVAMDCILVQSSYSISTPPPFNLRAHASIPRTGARHWSLFCFPNMAMVRKVPFLFSHYFLVCFRGE